MASVPDVSISIKLDGDPDQLDHDSDPLFTLEISAPRVSSQPLRWRKIVRIDQLSGLLAAVRASVETTSSELPLKLTTDTSSRVLNTLFDAGASVLSSLVGGKDWQGRAQQVQRLLLNALQTARADTIPSLEISCPYFLPVDLIPLPGDQFDSAQTRDNLSLQAAQTFVGFRFAIRQIGEWKSEGRSALLAEDERGQTLTSVLTDRGHVVLVTPYWHEGLRDIDRAMDELRMLPRLSFEHPLPDHDLGKSSTCHSQLASMLVAGRAHRDEQIVHVMAHCDARDDVPLLEHSIVLGVRRKFRGDEEFRISISNLNGALLRSNVGFPSGYGPIAFLNACGAADFTYSAPLSIPQALLNAGYRAVIAPLVSVSVSTAECLALHFYDDMSRSAQIATALVSARRKLIGREFLNPTGLLYSCYGDGSLHLES